MGEAQYVVAVLVEAAQQVGRRGARDRPAPCGAPGGRWVLIVAGGDDVLVAGAEAGQQPSSRRAAPVALAAPRCRAGRAAARPSAAPRTGRRCARWRTQLAQVVGVAQRVRDPLVAAIGSPAVVDRDAGEGGQHAGVVDPVRAAPVVQAIERQLVGRGRVQPAQPALHARAGLIEMTDQGHDQLLAHDIDEAVQVGRALGDDRGQRPRDDRCTQPIGQQLCRAVIGQMLIGGQIQAQRPHARPILRRRARARRKRRGRDVPARAAPPLAAVLADHQGTSSRQHLARLLAHHRCRGQIAAAARAALGRMPDNLVGALDPLQMMAAVTGLAARLATRRPPQTARHRRLGIPIRRRRPRRVTRVLRQPRTQPGDLRVLLGDPRLHRPITSAWAPTSPASSPYGPWR